MFIEIAFIQKFLLFLAHPLHAVAVVLRAVLVFAKLGSRWSARLQPDGSGPRRRPAVLATVLAIRLGFAAVVALAIGLYAIAPAAWP